MRTGRLRHYVTLQQKVETRGTSGGVSTTWSDVDQVWAGIEPLTGKEFLAAQGTQNEETVRIVIRHYPGIDASWRVKHDAVSPTLFYTISAIQNENMRDRMLILMCKEGPKSG